ncbi:hypothetical protein JHL18_06270 [Clostridium sp. YIM B02505]|uniref:Uncharacterized protein n=1 Tax=Clostridium yunnanense TaxID=2800325 RepID=A0ABS1ELJ3_9CLOT|nr:hypothetical protein [Clostridium yunnanense]MBK1810241.1 hypothetical protein [Clostridium yunnanense]
MKSVGVYVVAIVLFSSIFAGGVVLCNTNWYRNQSGTLIVGSGDTKAKHDFKVNKNDSNIEFKVKGELAQGGVNVRLLDSDNRLIFEKHITDSNRKEIVSAFKGAKGTWKMEILNIGAEGNVSYSMEER